MTEKANPSINRPIDAFQTAGAIALAGGSSTGWISPAASPSELAVQDGDITEGNLNAFAETSSGASLDVDIDAGEAFVYGSWLAIDTVTTVTLSASTSNQTVYVGWNKDGSDDVIVGLSSDFASASGDTDQKIPLWDFDTDGSGVTSVTDRRNIGKSVDGKFLSDTHSTSSDYTTSGEQLIFVDTSSNPVTITVSSTDIQSGNTIVVSDSAGNALNNNITIDTEGSETIDGSSTKLIDSNYGAVSLSSDGSNLFTTSTKPTDAFFSVTKSGVVTNGNAGNAYVTELADGESLEIWSAGFVEADGTPIPTGCDLIIATLDGVGGGTSQVTVLNGDGSTHYWEETGTPYDSYTNTSGSAQDVMIAVDNGNFNAGSGGAVDAQITLEVLETQ